MESFPTDTETIKISQNFLNDLIRFYNDDFPLIDSSIENLNGANISNHNLSSNHRINN